jgi:hypothetical protein
MGLPRGSDELERARGWLEAHRNLIERNRNTISSQEDETTTGAFPNFVLTDQLP